MQVDVDLPGGEKESLLVYEDDNLEDLVEVFSFNHCKI
jgi:hypothetical protein